MSAVAEKAPVSTLGSFIKKIEAKPATKVGPVVEQKKVEEVNDAATSTVEPIESVAAAPAKEAAKVDAVAEVKSDDKTEKRLKDAQTWGNEEHKARLAAENELRSLKATVTRLEQKFDGTYEEPALPSTEQVVANAESKGRIIASHKAAVRQYGLNFVMETVWNADSPYQKLAKRDPRIEADVLAAEDPVLAAIDAVKADQDGEKYGRTPEEIRKRMEAELAPKLKQEILEGLKTKPGPATNTLGNVRGGSERTEQKNGTPAKLDFRQVFPWGASRL